MPRVTGACRKLTPDREQWARDMWARRRASLTVQQMAKRLNCSHGAVMNAINRSPGAHTLNRWQTLWVRAHYAWRKQTMSIAAMARHEGVSTPTIAAALAPERREVTAERKFALKLWRTYGPRRSWQERAAA